MEKRKQKLLRTVVTVEVLHTDDVSIQEGFTLGEIAYGIVYGSLSGKVDVGPSNEVTKEQMRELLIAQGSAPEFLLDDDDDDDDDDEHMTEFSLPEKHAELLAQMVAEGEYSE